VLTTTCLHVNRKAIYVSGNFNCYIENEGLRKVIELVTNGDSISEMV